MCKKSFFIRNLEYLVIICPPSVRAFEQGPEPPTPVIRMKRMNISDQDDVWKRLDMGFETRLVRMMKTEDRRDRGMLT